MNNVNELTGILFETMITGDLNGVIERQEKQGQRDLCRSARLPIKYNMHNEDEYLSILNKIGVKIINKDNDDLFYNVELPTGWSIKPTEHSMWSNLVDDKGRERASIFYKAAFYDRDAFISFNRRFGIEREVPNYDKEAFELKPEYIVTGHKKVWVDEDGKEATKKVVDENDIEMYYYEDYSYGYPRMYCSKKQYKQVNKPIYSKNPDYVPLTGYEKYSQPFHYEVHDFDGKILYKTRPIKTSFEYSSPKHRDFFHHRDKLKKILSKRCEKWLKKRYPNWEEVTAYWD